MTTDPGARPAPSPALPPPALARRPFPRLRAREARAALLAALAFGAWGAFVFGAGGGLAVVLWWGPLAFALALLAGRLGRPVGFEGAALLWLGAQFAAFFAWRDSPMLAALNALALGAAFALGAMHLRFGGLSVAGPAQHLLSLLRGGLLAFGGAGALVHRTPWRAFRRVAVPARLAPLARGLLIAAPVLLGFGALLGSADAVFARLAGDVFAVDADGAARFVGRAAAWAWLAGGLAYAALFADPWRVPEDAPPPVRLGVVEVGIVLGGLALLFAAFLAVQGAYFFGGRDQVTALTGLTYAEYARRGFFELAAVVGLVLPLLLAARAVLPPPARRAPAFLVPSAAVTLLVLALLGSAARRLHLYVDAYGLTPDRLLAATFLGWAGLSLALFAVLTLRGREERFAFGALLLGFAALLALNVANPARLIARVNIDRAVRAAQVDTGPLSWAELARVLDAGADAAPIVIARLPDLPPNVRTALEARLAARARGPRDWRAWNAGRAAAARAWREARR